MIPQLVAESISKFKPAKSMHVRSVGHIRHSVSAVTLTYGIEINDKGMGVLIEIHGEGKGKVIR